MSQQFQFSTRSPWRGGHGERLWLSARDDARARAGSSFDLKEFHMQALRMGQMGLDTLRERLAAL